MVVLGALSAFGPLTTDAYLPALPQVGRDLEVGSSGVQLTLTACLLGLALGQLLAGPVSDAVGRRLPLLAGLGTFVLASLACTVAPSILALDVARLVQGLAGAAGIVLARAMVRDTTEGTEAARAFSTLAAITSTAPILAPLIGGALLRAGSWRGVFGFLTALGLALVAGVVAWTPETLPAPRRRGGSLPDALATYGLLLRDRRFVGHALAGGLAFAALFTYISTASFVYQDVFGFSPQLFAVLFGVNGAGILAASLLNRRLLHRAPTSALLSTGLVILPCTCLALLVVALSGAGAPVLLPVLFVAVASLGLIAPNTVALGLQDAGAHAGSAAALLGVLQFALGAAVAPLTGVLGGTPTILAATMAACGGLAWLAHRTLCRPGPAAVTAGSAGRAPAG